MQTTNRLLALFLGLMLLTDPNGVWAQSEHEGHHPKDASPPPTTPVPKDVTPAPQPGMGMMGDKDMSKMMQEMHGKMMGDNPGDAGPAGQAMNDAIMKMHAGMMLPYSGDADVDFTKRMIAHHQGAVAMAKVELAFGKDAAAKAAAEEVIKTNEADIAKLNEWLKSRGQ